MAKELKKTRLCSSKEFTPVGDGSRREEFTRVISADADGKFYASFPQELNNVADIVRAGDGGESRNYSFRAITYHAGFVVAHSKNEVIENWGSLVRRCEDYLKNLNKEKVIMLTTEMNIQYKRGDEWVIRKDVSFAHTSPVVGMEFIVCYRCGDKILSEDNKCLKDMGYRGLDKNIVIIPYSEEREAFLEHIAGVLDVAAKQLNEFQDDLKADPLRIDTIMKSGFLLENKQRPQKGAGQ